MLRQRISILFVILLICIGLITGLNFISYRVNRSPNHFLRFFPPHAATKTGQQDFRFVAGYISGLSDSNVYFGNNLLFNYLFSINIQNRDTQLIRLQLDSNIRIGYGNANIEIDSPYFFILGGSLPAIYRGKLNTWKAERYCGNSVQYDPAVIIRDSSFIFRVATSINGYTLIKGHSVNAHNELPKVLEGQGDSLFSKDGQLHYANGLNRIIYLYYYRNQFVVADTNLQVIYKGRTIDTVSRAKISIGKPDNAGRITMTSPPVIVNLNSCVSGDYLFVHSNLLADNEDVGQFNKASVIDVYDLKNAGVYKFSFYLWKHNGNKLKDFKVSKNLVVALYEHNVAFYKIQSGLLDD